MKKNEYILIIRVRINFSRWNKLKKKKNCIALHRCREFFFLPASLRFDTSSNVIITRTRKGRSEPCSC